MSEIDAILNPLPPAGPLAALPGGPAARAAAGKSVQAAKDFESILLYRMLEEMRRTIPESGLLEDSTSEQVQGIFWYHLAQEIGSAGGLGLWKEFHRQLTGRPPGDSEPSP